MPYDISCNFIDSDGLKPGVIKREVHVVDVASLAFESRLLRTRLQETMETKSLKVEFASVHLKVEHAVIR